MRWQTEQFVQDFLKTHSFPKHKKVLDVGSLNINGDL